MLSYTSVGSTRQGTSVEDLQARVREQERERQRQSALEAAARPEERVVKLEAAQPTSGSKVSRSPGSFVRRDSSPIKPLSGILNTERLLSTPHTSEQVSALWTAFHASRSGGTGRGFICASLPLETYRYPKFVVPLPRETTTADSNNGDSKKAHEFYILQWDFYDAPPPPSAFSDPFASKVPPEDNKSVNPQIATAIFAPLLEYKLRQAFATPSLVLTFYPDLASTHGLVLLRGEITPSAVKESTTGDYLLSQQDAQFLAHGLQRFYLWGSSEEREKLVSDFHERPGEFKWEELLKHGDLGV
ncbi:ATP11 protein-domain-containing protein [Multifurca ochricompacta]|uniref:ATP11 protein-domain-containing protein n=1 Tax=Multifurca ochricompacta TaxID=376703 RepID=A0AAD4LVQ7_9AGAM|nr:ATP11 protein-domain-containing protein [Multifurca ochricompacta]